MRVPHTNAPYNTRIHRELVLISQILDCLQEPEESKDLDAYAMYIKWMCSGVSLSPGRDTL